MARAGHLVPGISVPGVNQIPSTIQIGTFGGNATVRQVCRIVADQLLIDTKTVMQNDHRCIFGKFFPDLKQCWHCIRSFRGNDKSQYVLHAGSA